MDLRTRRHSISSALLLLWLALLAGCRGGGGGSDSFFTTFSLNASATSATTVALSWAKPGGLDPSSYVVETESGYRVGSTSERSYNAIHLTPDTRHCFVVRAFTIIGSAASNTACATTFSDTSPPSTPTGLAATATSPAEVALSWAASSDNDRVEAYNIFRDGVFLTSSAGSELTDTNAVPSTTHCYRVTASDRSGNESAASAESCATTLVDTEDPSVPSNVSATFSAQSGQSLIALTWMESTDDGLVKSYRIYRNDQYLTDAAGASYEDLDLQTDTSYCYSISAVDAAGKESGRSELACARESWSKTTLAPFGIYVGIAVDESDTPHIAYKFYFFDTTLDEIRSRLDYIKLSAGQPPSVDTLEEGPETYWISDSQLVGIAVDHDGIAHIAHKLSTGSLPETIQHIQKSTTSTQKGVIQQTENVMGVISLAIDSTGAVHSCYSLSGKLIYASNQTGAWVSVDASTLVPGAAGSACDIAVDSNDKIHISFTEAVSDDLMYLSNQSGSWAMDVLDASTTNVSAAYRTSIAVDAEGTVHIAYYHDTAEDDLEYATNASGNWVTSKIDSQGNVGHSAALALDHDGFVHITYQDFTDNKLQKYATNRSGTWEIGALSAAGVGDASIAVDSLDNVHIVFTDADGLLKYMTNRSQ
jgi:hypothetical protein